ncbi:hypothetical protein N7468_009899 [Penicillium chermesinum]|uniref:Uncharacterized protein n=1 Tax=Penicillium chermesinum TaxID=63820 RepID=A0A9W9TBY0_9EURO|nr:uncharacterized protein N7468_009899 [Penicillium chermesinum]KAJ5216891.1 hypothetical protein N7468_009899 [Penicillium chermesinum]KAJ6171496.1 hypothetical protein N7470_000563 [Penicillium chermesinum]
MGMKFDDVLSYANGAYYYEDSQLQPLPVADFSTGYKMSRKDIQDWFGVINTLPEVPKYFIVNETSLKSNLEPFRGNRTYVNGGWAVYEPVEWVPTMFLNRVIPKNEFPIQFNRTTTSINQTKLYAGLKSMASASASASYGAMKAEASVEIKGEIELDLDTKVVETMSQEGTLGSKPVHEVVLGMTIKMRRVYSWEFAEDDVTYLFRISLGPLVEDCRWSGATDGGNSISNESFRHVSELQYYAGYYKAQILPAFTKEKEVKKVHVALKAPTWSCWYVYEEPYGSPKNFRERNNTEATTMAWQTFKPVATFVAAA